jgi:hypothetical protein
MGVAEAPERCLDGSMLPGRSDRSPLIRDRQRFRAVWQFLWRVARTAPTATSSSLPCMSVKPPEAWQKAARTYMRVLVDAVRQAAA